MTSKRPLLAANLQRVDPTLRDDPVALSRAIDAAIDSYVDYWIESFRLSSFGAEALDRQMNWSGLEHLESAFAKGKGAIIALPHFGGWDFGGAWLAAAGYAPVVAVEALKPESLLKWFVGLREQLGMTVIPNSRTAAAELADHLRNNRLICLVSDRDLGRKGPTVSFFGEDTTMPAGPAVFAIRHGAPILPTIIRVDADGMHHGLITPPIDVDDSGDLRRDVATTMQRVAGRFEELIAPYATQWHLFQPNWPSDRRDGQGQVVSAKIVESTDPIS
jgi:KDO2-lipid IV(A) lauroyltransferase